MGLPVLRRPSRQRHKRGDKYHASRKIHAEVAENYRVGRPESNAYEKSATALSVGIPRHNATAFGGGRMSRQVRDLHVYLAASGEAKRILSLITLSDIGSTRSKTL